MQSTYLSILQGEDCRELFREAYENRYTWGSDFRGYKGECLLDDGNSTYQGLFNLSKDMKVNIENIDNKQINNLIASQVFEVAIHRVRRQFDNVHGENTFSCGGENQIGLEVIVGGKNSGDRYRIKDNVVTMVSRNIHGKLVEIFTNKVFYTAQGYLSTKYTSQYFDPSSKLPKTSVNNYTDEFIPIANSSIWTLSSRIIETQEWMGTPYSKMKFMFNNLRQY